MTDTIYRAPVADVRRGTLVQVDGGFTCMRSGAMKTVKQRGDELYVWCCQGRHFLDGQHWPLDGEPTHYTGLRIVRQP